MPESWSVGAPTTRAASAATRGAHKQTDPGCEVEIKLEAERDIAAKADECGVAERKLPGVAADQIPRHSEPAQNAISAASRLR